MSKNKKKFRMVHNSFWSDPKIVEEFTPEDKLVFLYLMTNSLSTQIGIYPITRKHIAYETGYSQESIKSIMDRFIDRHKIIKYDEDTRELFIVNWGKHNYRAGGTPMYDLVRSELSGIKNKEFIKEASDIVESEAIKSIFNEFLNDESCNESTDESTDESCNESGYEKENKKENEKKNKKEKKITPEQSSDDHEEIISYLNGKIKGKFKHTTKSTFESINGRMKEGYSVADFKLVIDFKVAEWINDEKWCTYLTPQTLFRPANFEKYYNQALMSSRSQSHSQVAASSLPAYEPDHIEEATFKWSKN